MDRRTPLALLETHGRLITEAIYFPSPLEGCAAQTLSASGLQAPVSNVRFGTFNFYVNRSCEMIAATQAEGSAATSMAMAWAGGSSAANWLSSSEAGM